MNSKLVSYDDYVYLTAVDREPGRVKRFAAERGLNLGSVRQMLSRWRRHLAASQPQELQEEQALQIQALAVGLQVLVPNRSQAELDQATRTIAHQRRQIEELRQALRGASALVRRIEALTQEENAS